jgi:hypothetical protein
MMSTIKELCQQRIRLLMAEAEVAKKRRAIEKTIILLHVEELEGKFTK